MTACDVLLLPVSLAKFKTKLTLGGGRAGEGGGDTDTHQYFRPNALTGTRQSILRA